VPLRDGSRNPRIHAGKSLGLEYRRFLFFAVEFVGSRGGGRSVPRMEPKGGTFTNGSVISRLKGLDTQSEIAWSQIEYAAFSRARGDQSGGDRVQDEAITTFENEKNLKKIMSRRRGGEKNRPRICRAGRSGVVNRRGGDLFLGEGGFLLGI